MTDEKKPEHAAKLRDDIDKGRSGDKIGFPDPAAAPLGTDAEAGGAGPTPEEVRLARQHEVEGRPTGPAAAHAPRPVSAGGSARGQRRTWIVIVALALIGFLLFLAVLQ